MSIKANPIFARLITAKKITARLIQTFSKICRYFSTFDGSSSYAALTDEIVLSGDFEIEFKFKQTAAQKSANTYQTVISLSTPLSSYFVIGAKDAGANRLKIGTNGYTAGQSSFIFQSDTEYKINVIVDQSTGSIIVNRDDVFDHSYTHANLTDLQNLKLEKIGDRHDLAGRSFSGQMHGLKIWSGGDRTTGTLILDLPMSEGLKDVYDEVFYRNRVQTQAEWILSLNNAAYVEVQDISLTGSYEIEFNFVTDQYSTTNPFLGTTSEDSYIRADSATSVKVGGIGGGVASHTFTGINTLLANTKYKLILKNVAGTKTLNLNGSTLTTTTDFGSLLIQKIGGKGVNFFNGQLSNLKIWQGGDRTTGNLIIDSALDDNSNISANAASPVNANVWDDLSATVIGDSEILGNGSYRIYSPDGSYSAVKVSSVASANVDYLVEVEVVSGDINQVIMQEVTTDFSGWQNIRDAYGQPTNKYKTIVNSVYMMIQIKRNTAYNPNVDITIKNITVREVEGYGVLQGTRNTDYEWKNETPHAIGYNVETNEVCTTDGTNWVDADLWNDSDAWSD